MPKLRLAWWLAPRSYAILGAIALALALSPGAAVFVVVAALLAMAYIVLVCLDALRGPRIADLELRRIVPDHVALRVPLRCSYSIENRSSGVLRIGIGERALRTLRDDAHPLVVDVPPLSRASVERTLMPIARGRDEFGPLDIWFEGSLRLLRRRATIDARAAFRVYPDLAAVERYGSLRARNRLIEAGLRRMRMRGEGTAFESLREYGSGDAFRSVDWKATARRGKLMVAQREVERSQDVLMLLDCGRLMTPRIAGQRKLDYTVTAALSLASIAALANDRVGVVAFARELILARAPRSTAASVRALADALCDVEPRFEESDYAHAFAYARDHLHRRSLVVLFTDVIDSVAQSIIATELASLARRHVVLCVLMSDAAIEHALAHVPATVDEAYAAQAALAVRTERKAALARLERVGVGVLDVPAGGLSVAAIDAYLRIKQRGLL